MVACEAGHLDVVKHLCEIGGERLLSSTSSVSAVMWVLPMYCVLVVQAYSPDTRWMVCV
jgi:hypothetical protein